VFEKEKRRERDWRARLTTFPTSFLAHSRPACRFPQLLGGERERVEEIAKRVDEGFNTNNNGNINNNNNNAKSNYSEMSLCRFSNGNSQSVFKC
jgi:hypothetical protein